MDKLENYRKIIQRILTEYQQWAAGSNQPGVQQCLSFDEAQHQDLWLHGGWQEGYQLKAGRFP
ncbi:element excision factor XisI family protein [Leptothoe sp. PORK10 BA2]|uniref:element excision factor XisI family protein n=1 Tax=Leptothoe sp. PORK10 BA2 TaxID=3110254 RepID=UPI002B1F9177|nr:element excision factor XisI family protein [Leptothoe sp. PORK10 BA2]MEA5464122.1 element excision factor XisI family protein [Leptothoe sp. PORK10 BA2]